MVLRAASAARVVGISLLPLAACALALLLEGCRHVPEAQDSGKPPLPEAVWKPGRADWGMTPSARRVSHVRVEKPYVAVTFDDGPHPSLTPQVLDIFRKHDARATFFVLGRSSTGNRSLLARAVAEGHEIGAHSWSHINMRSSSTERIFREFDRTFSVVEQATGYRPWVIRPPYGAVNARLVNLMYERYGTPAILWDVDTRDWRRPGVQKVIRRAVDNAQPGSIILLHDIHPSTIAAVEGIVTGLQKRGFQLVTVSQLLAAGPAGKPEVTPLAGKGKAEKEAASEAVPQGHPLIAPSGEKEEDDAPVTSQKQPSLPPPHGPVDEEAESRLAEPLPPVLLGNGAAATGLPSIPSTSF